MEKVKAPGLKWRKLATGLSPVWVADEVDVRNGYRPKTINLKHAASDPELLIAHCNAAQTDMLLWRAGHRRDPLAFDGTVRSLLTIYELHERSSFQRLKPGSRRPYLYYIGSLKGHIGRIRLDDINGVDILDWHEFWSSDGKHLAAAAMARSVLEAAISFGIMLRLAGCAELAAIFREARAKLPAPKARTAVLTAEQVVKARQAAHADGRPSSALAYALAFETTLRLWDVIGQWYPINRPELSDVVNPQREEKWFGLRWEDIDAGLRLTYTPSKTAEKSGATISYPLTKAPMVLEELAHWPAERRSGPVVVSEKTSLPYRELPFQRLWAKDRKAAGIAASVWARDLRASGITEGRATDVSTDDAAKVAGHKSTRTTKIYDRAVVEASDRFAEARIRARERNGNGSGNAR